jgi:CBS domain-containing protein
MTEHVAAFLSKHPPFSGLPELLSGEAARRATVRHLPRGESLDVPGARDALAPVYVVNLGRIDLYSESDRFATLLPGEMFGFSGFVPGRSLAAHRAVAEKDCVLIEIAAEAFALLAGDEGFAARLAAEAARLGEALERVLRARQSVRLDPFMRLTIENVELATPVRVSGEATLAEAASRMMRSGVSACLVERQGAVAGILTERDVLRAVAARDSDPREVLAERAMTAKIITIGAGEPLFEAFALMVKHAIRRLVVVNLRGEPVGIVGEGDLLAVRGESPVHLAREIAEAESPAALNRAFGKMRSLALRSLAEGVPVDTLGRLISEMHDQIIERAASVVAGGLGAPLGRFAVVVLGSEGRKEQFLATDQDNAMLLGDGLDEAGTQALTLFSERFIQALLAIGFPPCPSRVMADNPQWRRSLRGWEDYIDDLALAATPEAVLTLSLLADMRPVAGDEGLCESLRGFLSAKVKDSPVLLKYMAREALRFSPPIGFFGNFVPERTGECKGRADLKKGGIFPVVQGLRALALDHGLTETGTLDRLARLKELGTLSEGLCARLTDAYGLLQTLRVTAQAEAVREGRVPDNCLDLVRLAPAGRDRLKEAFRAVVDFQTLLHGKYALQLMI